MKRVRYSLLLAFLAVCQTYAADATLPLFKKEFTKQIKKEFPIDANGEVALTNKYGKLDVKTWNESRVKIDVTITVNAKDESKANEIFDRISIDFTNSPAYVKAETNIESAKKSWWSWGNSRGDFTIDYEVLLPASSNVDLNNKYGDVFAEAISGKASVKVKYGNFRIEGVEGKLDVSLGYGNGTVVSGNNIDAYVQYGKLRIKKGEDVNLETKYSKITLENVGDIRTESKYDGYSIGNARRVNCTGKYDNYEIESAESIEATARYSDYAVYNLGKRADFSLEYGEADIENVSSSFEEINVSGKYTSYKIDVEDGASYSLDATSNYAGIRYPNGMNIIYEKDKANYQEVKGNMGNPGKGGVIKARLSYGGLRVE